MCLLLTCTYACYIPILLHGRMEGRRAAVPNLASRQHTSPVLELGSNYGSGSVHLLLGCKAEWSFKKAVRRPGQAGRLFKCVVFVCSSSAHCTEPPAAIFRLMLQSHCQVVCDRGPQGSLATAKGIATRPGEGVQGSLPSRLETNQTLTGRKTVSASR